MKPNRILSLGLVLSLWLGACQQQSHPADEDPIAPVISSSPTTSPTQTSSNTPTNSPVATFTSLPPSSTSTPISTLTPTPLTCWGDGGHIEHQVMETDWLPQLLTFSIYLPPCYSQQTNHHYPVLYLIHGQGYDDAQWDRLGADEAADKLIASGDVLPFIIIMPRDDMDHSPPPKNHFGDAIIFDLIPYIDSQYRTITERESRAIGGLSRGGNWALHLGLSQWGYFGTIGAHSAPTFLTDGLRKVRSWLAAIPTEDVPRIYLDTGENDPWAQTTLQLENLFNEENVPHEWYLFPGYHEEEYWASHVEQYLRWYTSDWKN